MKKGIFLLACLIGMFSCTDHKDVFDPNAEAEKKKEEYDKNFPVTDIDPNQDWKMFTTVKAKVTVDEIFGETYTIKIYTANPLDEKSGAMLLAKGEIKNGETFSVDIELPKGLSGVFVSRTDTKGECLFQYASLKDGQITTFFGEVKGRSVQSRGLSLDEKAKQVPYTESVIEGYLQGAKELPKEGLDWAIGYYKVTTDVSLSSFKMQASSGQLWLIVAEGATLTVDEGSMTNDNVHLIVYNGTFSITESFEAKSTGPEAVVYPNGRITGTGKFEITNNWGGNTDKMLYNAGVIDVNTLHVNGGTYYNCGTTRVSAFHNTTNGGQLVNYAGSVEIGKAYIQNMTIYNNCKMKMATNAESDSEFKDCYLGDGAYLEVTDCFKTGSGSNIYLGNGAILNAGIYMSNNASIHGVDSSSEKAYIKFGRVEGNTFGQSSGYYTIDAGDYSSKLTEWSKGQFQQNILQREGVKFGSITVTAPDNDTCSGSITINKDPAGGDTPNCAYYAFEDFGSVGDYDFNDVVLKVSHTAGLSTATVELVAAGGTLETSVNYEGQTLWDEVHRAFGVELSTMVNTGRGDKKDPLTASIQVASNAKFEDLKFSIKVTYSDGVSTSEVVSVPSTGSAPQYLCVPGQWKWPKENASITSAYNRQGENGEEGHSFAEWAQDSSKAQDWYLYPTGLVMGMD